MSNELKRLTNADFPPLLFEIADAPTQLTLRGTLPDFKTCKLLAVVGSRTCSAYGKQVLRYLIQGLRGYPIVIVSGLAYGIDAEAHKAALENGLTTIAIPGSGLDWDVLYPRAHVFLAKEILEKSGALLSEFDFSTTARDYTFPQRNRIIAGMSHATLIVEAKERSGSLITARLTTEYNRELLVVPGSIFSEESKGVHQFLKLGATPITESADILRALGIEKRVVGQSTPRTDVSPAEKAVLEILSTPCTRDELISQLDGTTSETNILLSTMEIKGLLVEEFGVVRAL